MPTKNKLYPIIIIAASLITHFAFFGFPESTVFDEVHFGKFISGYLNREHFFDIHPPLGKLMIAGVAKITNFRPDFDFAKIGEKYPANHYKYMRFLPTLAGTLLPLIIYLIARRLKISENLSLLAGLFIVFENSLIVQSRFILMDSFMLIFGFTAIYFYFKKSLLWAGIFGALALSIKWTGASFLGLIGLFYFIEWLKPEWFVRLGLKSKNKQKNALKGLFYLIVIPFLIYYAIFSIHFSLLTKPGPGDAFMSENFQSKSLSAKFIELNKKLYTANRNLNATHPFSSNWYQWPLMQKPIFYWNDGLPAGGRIYLAGNPIIWLLGTVSIVWLLLKKQTKKTYFILSGYFLNLLPFIFIGRVMFLYHYFIALIFSILATAYILNKYKIEKSIYFGLLAGIIILFLIFSPLTYGFAMPQFFNQIFEAFL